MIIDRKFKILATNPCKEGSVHTDHDSVLFLAKDAALPAALKAYQIECERIGCGVEHIQSIALLRDRVDEYQCRIGTKVPDTETDCEINRCIGGAGVEDESEKDFWEKRND